MALGDRTPLDAASHRTTGEPYESSPPSCEECGVAIDARAAERSRKRYCSPRSRSRVYYREHRPVRLDKLDVDTVPLSPREEAMMAESAEDIARGNLITDEELRARLGLRAAR
jgi:hypothetical protein